MGKQFLKQFENFNLHVNQVVSVTTDTAANMNTFENVLASKGVTLLEIRHVQARSAQKLNPVQPIQKMYRQMKAIPQLVLRQG